MISDHLGGVEDEAANSTDEAYLTSLIDLFGCGFIAAIFLFLIFVGAEAVSGFTSTGAAVFGNDGATVRPGLDAPVFLEVTAPAGSQLKWGSLDSFQPSKIEDKNKLIESVFVPDGRTVQWPVLLEVQFGSSSHAARDIKVAVQSGSSEAVLIVNSTTGGTQVGAKIQAGRRLKVEPVGIESKLRLEVHTRALDPRHRRYSSFVRLADAHEVCTFATLGPKRLVTVRQRSEGRAEPSQQFECGGDKFSEKQEVTIDRNGPYKCRGVEESTVPQLWARSSGAGLKCGP